MREKDIYLPALPIKSFGILILRANKTFNFPCQQNLFEATGKVTHVVIGKSTKLNGFMTNKRLLNPTKTLFKNTPK